MSSNQQGAARPQGLTDSTVTEDGLMLAETNPFTRE